LVGAANAMKSKKVNRAGKNVRVRLQLLVVLLHGRDAKVSRVQSGLCGDARRRRVVSRRETLQTAILTDQRSAFLTEPGASIPVEP
jgi:hypothetical protein